MGAFTLTKLKARLDYVNRGKNELLHDFINRLIAEKVKTIDCTNDEAMMTGFVGIRENNLFLLSTEKASCKLA